MCGFCRSYIVVRTLSGRYLGVSDIGVMYLGLRVTVEAGLQ